MPESKHEFKAVSSEIDATEESIGVDENSHKPSHLSHGHFPAGIALKSVQP